MSKFLDAASVENADPYPDSTGSCRESEPDPDEQSSHSPASPQDSYLKSSDSPNARPARTNHSLSENARIRLLQEGYFVLGQVPYAMKAVRERKRSAQTGRRVVRTKLVRLPA